MISKTKVSASTPQKLNVVLIVADDLGWGETGCYGQEKILTPHIDQLAKAGTRFTQFYSGAPVCAPSRCVLMTGKHLGHAEIRSNRPARLSFPEYSEGQYPLSSNAVTIPQMFQQAGYKTGAFGKWGLGPVGSTGSPDLKGFETFFGYNCQTLAHSYYPEYLWKNREKVHINSPAIPGRLKVPMGEIRAEHYRGENYAPYRIVEEAEKFISQHRQQPFFLYLPFIEPHVALHPPEETLRQYPAEWDSDVYRGESGYLPHPRPRAAYAALISDLDRYVGRIIQKLEEHNLAEKTLVIFTSDNGTTHQGPKGTRFFVGGSDAEFFKSTRGLKGFKGSVYEGGIRVPFIAKLPGVIQEGKVEDTPAYFADLFPTLCHTARLTTPAELDGADLWPVLTTDAPLKRSLPMIWVFPGYGGQVAVRLGDFKVLRQNLQTSKPGEWEVYQLAHDPGEQNDIAHQHPEVIDLARKILAQQISPNEIFPLNIPGVTDME